MSENDVTDRQKFVNFQQTPAEKQEQNAGSKFDAKRPHNNEEQSAGKITKRNLFLFLCRFTAIVLPTRRLSIEIEFLFFLNIPCGGSRRSFVCCSLVLFHFHLNNRYPFSERLSRFPTSWKCGNVGHLKRCLSIYFWKLFY